MAAPSPSSIVREEAMLRFPSAWPIGRPEIDQVALKLYPAPEGAPRTGVLFHHWVYMDGWLAADWLLRPLVQRLSVAAMVAPHHATRRPPEAASGEGLLNANPRHIFEGFRQWLADHRACLELLRRDHGFERVVVLGYSMGAYFTLMGRICGGKLPTVAVSCTNNYAGGVFHGEHTAALRDRVVEAGFTRESFSRATRAFHLARWAERIGGDELTLICGRYDRMEPPESQSELLEALQPERAVTVPGGHSTVIFNRRRICDEVIRRVEGIEDRREAR